MTALRSNFAVLESHDQQLVRLGILAERYFPDDPNTSLLKLRQLAELLAQLVATKVGVYQSVEESQYELIRRLLDQGVFTREIAQLFGEIRRVGNAANHDLSGNHRVALSTLKIAWQLSVWFHRSFKDSGYKSGPFIPPQPPKDESEELKRELDRLSSELATYRDANTEAAEQLQALDSRLRQALDEQSFWEQLAEESERSKAALAGQLEALQSQATTQSRAIVTATVSAANNAAASLQLDEADTRQIIDEQLRVAGWQTDSDTLRYSLGTRPEKGKNLAISEWPTESGPADYVLFVGLIPVAAIEAKRKNIDVSAALQQAKRYSRGFQPPTEIEAHTSSWGDQAYRLPFIFSSNGRPYLRQLETKSGVWFCDLRKPDNLGHALNGWYTPEGLTTLLKRDEDESNAKLRIEPFRYGFPLRDYQRVAIEQVESAIARGQREMLLAMATGTGKTKTCIALIYRLLKVRRFRRILFLVDRAALGEQAANAFKDTRMESLQTFADTFGIKELDEQNPQSDTAVHIATVQGMVKRLMFPSEGAVPPTVDQYDCIIVDECHRGYLLDREMAESEMVFRSQEDYISKYRRVVEYFDAFKIGLTATPALHTTEIFGPPIYTYSYREAVIDGYLIDHEPPIQIDTALSTDGISWMIGEEVAVYDTRSQQINLFNTPDEISIDVEGFNRRVITESFNRVICAYLASELDPASPQKTLIFCASDSHADMVVALLKKEFAIRYGTVDDDAVIKITGAADKPLKLIRRFKNERLPTIAVTVDLLTTGIDVPEICNIVFLRRVGSRILFDQMMGRATRLCPEIGKETFRIFDAVKIYEALENLTAMRPVVVNPAIPFSQLTRELATVGTDEGRALVRDQFLAKAQRKKHHLGEDSRRDFETIAGMPPDEFIRKLRDMPLSEIADWFTQHPGLGEILDRKGEGIPATIYISNHPDELRGVERGYGRAQKPQDYLDAFANFLVTERDRIPALITVLTRPRDLTRKQLRELLLELDRAGFSEANLAIAWRELTNEDVAARIIGYIRQAAAGEPLQPWGNRVEEALRKMLASRQWTSPQRQWLQRIAAQTKTNIVVDLEALNDPDLIFQREGGGFNRLDRLFDGKLAQVLDEFHDSLWQSAA